MKIENLRKKWLKAQELQKEFSGWDFSYLKGRWETEDLPWNYRDIVSKYLRPEHQLLDMRTGGGELLRTFDHPFHQTAVTEGWQKNYQLLLKTLKLQGVNDQFVDDQEQLNFADDSFDLVINSHGSFSICEVRRVLKKDGFFISQQVGDINGNLLASKLLSNFRQEKKIFNLSEVSSELRQTNFEVIYENEYFPDRKFYDMEGLIYYVRTIPWEFPDFSVKTNFDELLQLQEELIQKGFVQDVQHRFIFVARIIK